MLVKTVLRWLVLVEVAVVVGCAAVMAHFDSLVAPASVHSLGDALDGVYAAVQYFVWQGRMQYAGFAFVVTLPFWGMAELVAYRVRRLKRIGEYWNGARISPTEAGWRAGTFRD